MNDSIHLKLTIPELNLMLEALGGMPYYKVYELIGKLQNQAQEQLNGSTGKPASIAEPQRAASMSNGVPEGE